jgi:PAS domain S-box-containing protein
MVAGAATEALKLLTGTLPVLVVLAVDLPEIDGFTVCKRIKADPRTAAIPVLHISAHRQPHGDYPASLESGAEAYLPSPVEPGVLIAVVTALIAQIPGPRVLVGMRDFTERQRAEAALRQSEAQLGEFVEDAPAAIAMLDRQMRYLAVSRRYLRDYGLGEQDLIGRSHYDVFPEMPERWKEIHRRCLAGAVEKCDEDPFPRANGKVDWVRWVIHPWRDSKSEIGGIVIFSEQITERKQTEQALRASEQRYRTLFEAMTEGFWLGEVICDEAGKPYDFLHLAVNPAYARHTGVMVEDLLGRTTREVYPGAEAIWFERYAKVALTGEAVRFEEWFGPLGRWFEISAFQTEPGRFGVVFTDITNRKRADEALRESEAVLQGLFDSPEVMRGIVEIVDGAIVHLSCNQAAAQMYGVDRESIAGKPATAAGASPEIAQAWVGLYEKSRRTGQPVSMEYGRRDAAGQARWMLATASYLRIGASGHPRFAYTMLDLTDRKRAEGALRESEERFRAIYEHGWIGIAIRDLQGRLKFVNPAFQKMLGYQESELIGKGFREITLDTDLAAESVYAQDMLDGKRDHYEMEKRYIRKDGELIWVWLSAAVLRDSEGKPAFGLSMAQDITERKRAEAQLMHAQKMESVGRLAGGVAHDFNNLLTLINGYSRMALDDLKPDDPLRDPIEEIYKAGGRAAGLTQQLLAFSRKQVLQPRVLDLNRVVADMRPMLARLMGEDVELRVVLHPGATTIRADPHQLAQVVMNLAVNSRDAMPRGGRLSIETRIVEAGEGPRPEECTSPSVMLAVSDNGEGMDEETRRHIFEPFYTTKAVGKGTGLGLSTVQGIVEQSGGYIEVQSAPGHGTTFRIYLPMEKGVLADAEKPEVAPAIGGDATVLVVEDQAEVRKYTAVALGSYGYRVIQAETAAEALLLCEREHERIDLVLTDVVMPNMSGGELSDRLRERWPGIKVLFMSGYTGDAILHHGVLDQGAEFIQKPFSPGELAVRVRDVLAG